MSQTDARQRTTRPAADADEPGSPGRRRRGLLNTQVSKFGGLYIWALFILVFALWVPNSFLTMTTLRSVAGDQAITAVLAIGLLFSLAAGTYDLSVAQNLGMCAVFCGWLTSQEHVSPWLAVIATIALGLLIGVVNGFLVAVIGLNSFIATLGTQSVLLAITEIVTNYNYVGPVPTGFQRIANAEPLGIPILTIYVVVLAVVVWYVLQHTPLGRRLQATGVNADASRLAGIRTGRFVFGALVATGGFASIAGILVAARISTISTSVGPPYLLPAFAACFLGTTQFRPGRFNVWGTLVALYLLATGVKGLQLAGGQLWVTDLFNGVALIGAVSIAVVSERRRTSKST